MNCANCGAPLRPRQGGEHLICDSCRSIRHLEANADGVVALGSETSLLCPVCRLPLVDAVIAGESVHHCPNCRGTLLEADVFLLVAAHLRLRGGKPPAPHSIEPAELARSIACPRCSRTMDTHPYAGPGNIVIDNCPACSLNWMDYLELRRVATAADDSPNPDAWKAL